MEATSTSSPPTVVSAESQAHIRLACQACQRKKIKCDRTFPCGQCVKSSLECLPSSRKQRTRHAGRRAVDGELRNRIAKLESLVESLSGDVHPASDKSTDEVSASTPPPRTSSMEFESPRVGKYVANTFWSSLSGEVNALREALEEDDENESPGDTLEGLMSSPGKADGSNTFEHDLIICPPGRIYVMPGVMEDPSPQVKKQMNALFLRNVERMMKVFHTPTIKATLEDDAPYLGHQPGSPQHGALKRLAWFSAINSLSDPEVLAITGQNKVDVLPKYRRYVEILLSQSDIINTSDLATLQCFLVFIAVCRSTDSSRRTWTILAMLVRIAHAMYLNHEDVRATPFVREMRRRLWHYIRFLDKFCALDRGSIPLIRQEEHTTPLPTSTDDHLFGPDSSSVPIITDRLTDMSFAIMCMEACDVVEALIVPEFKPSGATWEQRYQIAFDLGKQIESKYLVHCDVSNPWHRLQHSIGRSMSTAMLLRAVRPMQRHISSVPPPVNSPYVLQLAVDNLTEAERIFQEPELEAWRWMKWVPWHSLACALAGLCSIRGTELANKAWKVVEPAYVWSSRYVADSQDGMLWRPVAKLYKKACAFRDAGDVPRSLQTTEQKQQVPVTDGVGLEEATNNTAKDTAQLQLDSLMLQQPAAVDNLSNNFSTLTPFTYTSLFELPVPPRDAGLAPSNDINMTDFNDVGWTDWNQVMDEYADPLSLIDGSVDVNAAFGDWKWNPKSGAGFGGL